MLSSSKIDLGRARSLLRELLDEVLRNQPPACLPVACEAYCPNGNKLDSTGCYTCECNAPSPCPDPSDPQVRYLVNSHQNPSACSAIRFGCPAGQESFSNACGCGCIERDNCSGAPVDGNGGCSGGSDAGSPGQGCRSMLPGCGADPLPAAGCYVTCMSDADCAVGETCQSRSADPCAAPLLACDACGAQVSVCLP